MTQLPETSPWLPSKCCDDCVGRLFLSYRHLERAGTKHIIADDNGELVDAINSLDGNEHGLQGERRIKRHAN